MLCATFKRLFVAAAGLIGPATAQAPTKTDKPFTVWLPPQSTGARESIYASVITAAPSSTEFLLACTTNFRSASSCAQFGGVTLTYGNETLKVAFKTDTYDCKRGSAATCSVGSARSIIASSESASWFTAITIVDGHDKLGSSTAKTSSTSTGPASAATSSANGVCKRAINVGNGGSDADIDVGTNSATRPKTNSGGGGGDDDDGCSRATGGFASLPLIMAGFGTVVAVAVTVYL